jgi:hypothetical protein
MTGVIRTSLAGRVRKISIDRINSAALRSGMIATALFGARLLAESGYVTA